jgi:serine/threonine protein kinase
MAEVYAAKTRGIGGFEKLVAIKVIHPRYSEDEHFIQLLIEEAKISVLLNHVNVGQVYDLGCIDDTYFIVMEYIEGVDAFRILRRASEMNVAVPLDVCAYIGAELCHGLDYAHRRTDAQGRALGIVHRDISPQNVLISFSGEVKIVDFGIAKAAFRVRQTEAGVIKGKYYYMSPEQAWGDAMDHRSDIFSAGIVLHELLSGEMLYPDEALPNLLDKVRKAAIPRPSEKRSDVPPELDEIVMGALQKKPSERWESAHDMGQALSQFLYRVSPAFTASRLAQFLAKLFPAEFREQTGAPSGHTSAEVQLPSEEVTSRGGRRSLTSMRREEFAPQPESVIHRETGGEVEPDADDSTRDDLPPVRLAPKHEQAPAERASGREPVRPVGSSESPERSASSGSSFGGRQNPVARRGETRPLAEASADPSAWDDETRAGGGLKRPGRSRSGATVNLDAEPDTDSRPSIDSSIEDVPSDNTVVDRRESRSSRSSSPRPPPGGAQAEEDWEEESTLVSGVAESWDDPTHIDEERTAEASAAQAAARETGARAGSPETAAGEEPRDTAAGARELPGRETAAVEGPRGTSAAAAVPSGTAAGEGQRAEGKGGPGKAADKGEPPRAPSSDTRGARGRLPPPPDARDGESPALPTFPPPPRAPSNTGFEGVPDDSSFTGGYASALREDRRQRLVRWSRIGAFILAIVALFTGGAVAAHLMLAEPELPTLEIRSIPPGAQVWIDGELQPGTTPMTLRKGLTKGTTHEVEVRREGFRPWTTEVELGDQPLQEIAHLTRRKATLEVTSSPAGATVWVEGNQRGTTPVSMDGLDTDLEVDVRIERDGFRPEHESVRIGPDQSEAKLHVKLRPDSGDPSSE